MIDPNTPDGIPPNDPAIRMRHLLIEHQSAPLAGQSQPVPVQIVLDLRIVTGDGELAEQLRDYTMAGLIDRLQELGIVAENPQESIDRGGMRIHNLEGSKQVLNHLFRMTCGQTAYTCAMQGMTICAAGPIVGIESSQAWGLQVMGTYPPAVAQQLHQGIVKLMEEMGCKTEHLGGDVQVGEEGQTDGK